MIQDVGQFVGVSVAIAGSVVALIAAVYFAFVVKDAAPGNSELVRISGMIRTGAKAYLATQYKWLSLWVVCLAIIIGSILRQPNNDLAGLWTVISYVVGSFLSGSAGYLGMMAATSANARTAEACRTSISRGLQVAFASGAIMGNAVVGLALAGLWVFYLIWSSLTVWTGYPDSSTGACSMSVTSGVTPYAQFTNGCVQVDQFNTVWLYISGFGFGASSIGMFARVGGGVFTKAADVGADLVGKVEQGIPEDDPRNPAVIADNVGDNVGDVAGMGADLFESYAGALIACATLSSQLFLDNYLHGYGSAMTINQMLASGLALPFWVYGFGVFASLLGVAVVRGWPLDDNTTLDKLLKVINYGIIVASVASVATTILACLLLFDSPLCWRLVGCIVIGLFAGVVISTWTEYQTSYEDFPTRDISAASEYGPAPVIIKGIGLGMWSVSIPTIAIVITVLACNALAGLYGVSIAAVGMLQTLGITLATDAYGPVADNAGGVAEMAGLESFVRSRTDKLDSLGNTTAATGKGLAIGSALLTAVGLLAAFLDQSGIGVNNVSVGNPIVLSGVLIGCALPYIFGALTMLSVDRGARAVITEVRLQFATAPRLMKGDLTQVVDGHTYPDSTRCVALATEAAIQEMLMPGMLAVFLPVGTGFLLGPLGLGGLLAGIIGTCFMLALTMSNAGGAWDNSKKWCEKCAEDGEPLPNGGVTFTNFGVKKEKLFEELEGPNGPGWKALVKAESLMPRTEAEKVQARAALLALYHARHSATITGDTVGDPFKDTSGPSLNILQKTATMVSLMLAPVYKSVGQNQGFGGFARDGVIAAAVMAVVVGTAVYVAVAHFRKINAINDAESIKKKRAADERLRLEEAEEAAGKR